MKCSTLQIALCLAFLIPIGLTGQDTLFFQQGRAVDTIPGIRAAAMYDEAGVTLRWAPTDALTWTQLNTKGYSIRRTQLNREGLPMAGTQKVFVSTAWPVDRFREWMDSDRDFILAAGQCLYGESGPGPSAGLDLYGQQQTLTNRFGISLLAADMDPVAADALGLRLLDPDVGPDRLYLYEVFPADTSLKMMHGPVTVFTKKLTPPVPVIDHLTEGEGYVLVKWSRAAHEEEFSAYIVEASPDGNQFTALTQRPFVGGRSETYPGDFFAYRHEVENYTPMWYRIRGMNAFGKISDPSAPLRGQARDKTPPGFPQQLTVDCDAMTNTVTLRWINPTDPDLEGTMVYKSSRYDGPYAPAHGKILPPALQRFEDVVADPSPITYYKVVAQDTAGNLQSTRIVQAAFRDTLPPATPSGLQGSVDSLGVVTLRWDAGREADLEGYQVYMANHPDHFFTNMTRGPIPSNQWNDTIQLRTFTEEIYYRVAAVDFHSHVSEWSEPVRLSRPDTLRPLPPSFTGYRVEKDHIRLSCSPGKSRDIVRHELWKQKLPAREWIKVNSFDIDAVDYRDFDIIPGDVYAYRLQSIDDAGLICAIPAEIRIKCVDHSRPVAPEIIRCVHEDSGIRLEWQQPEPRTKSIAVFRSENGGPFTTIGVVALQQTYLDTQIKKNTSYEYKIKSSWDNGLRSSFSEPAVPKVQ